MSILVETGELSIETVPVDVESVLEVYDKLPIRARARVGGCETCL